MNLEPRERSEDPQRTAEQLFTWLSEGNIQDETIIGFLSKLNLPEKSKTMHSIDVNIYPPAKKGVHADVFYDLRASRMLSFGFSLLLPQKKSRNAAAIQR
jgi:hypothetical protein